MDWAGLGWGVLCWALLGWAVSGWAGWVVLGWVGLGCAGPGSGSAALSQEEVGWEGLDKIMEVGTDVDLYDCQHARGLLYTRRQAGHYL